MKIFSLRFHKFMLTLAHIKALFLSSRIIVIIHVLNALNLMIIWLFNIFIFNANSFSIHHRVILSTVRYFQEWIHSKGNTTS
jgi:hypothetical protein